MDLIKKKAQLQLRARDLPTDSVLVWERQRSAGAAAAATDP